MENFIKLMAAFGIGFVIVLLAIVFLSFIFIYRVETTFIIGIMIDT